MKKFKFSLEGLIKVRKYREEQLRVELNQLQAKVQKEEQDLYQMYEKIEETYQLGLQYKQEGISVPPKLDNVDNFIYAEKLNVEKKSNEIRQLKQLIEKKEFEWLEARKELKIIEKLREKKEKIHKVEQRKIEQKKLDDLISTNRGSKRDGSLKY